VRYREIEGTGEKDGGGGWKGFGMAEMERLDGIGVVCEGVGTVSASGVECCFGQSGTTTAIEGSTWE
jgi:hypothetical protein